MNHSRTDGQQKGWFMHKRGKQWVYGCSLLVAGMVVLAGPQPVFAEEANVTNQSVASVDQSQLDVQDGDKVSSTVEATNAESETPAIVAEEVAMVVENPVVETTTSGDKMAELESPATLNPTTNTAIVSEDKAEPADELAVTVPTTTDLVESRAAEEQAATTTGFQTNLEGLTYDSSVWEVRADGLYSNALGKGDNFLFSESTAGNFVFETDVTFLQDAGAASLLFRSNNDPNNLKSYVVNLDGHSHKVKFWRWAEANLIEEKEVAAREDKTYHLRVVAANDWISYYVNDELVANLGDYTVQRNDMGQKNGIVDGHFGILNWNGEMLFQNTYFTPLADNELPFIDDISVTSKTGTVESKGQFFPEEATHIQYVHHSAETVDLHISPRQAGTVISVSDQEGNSYQSLEDIPLQVGVNMLTIKSSLPGQAELVYRLNVHRRQPDEVYHNELYRGQYHYSVKDGWGNDPNGLVYYNGTYHLFYQFYDDTEWGPMHWAHATSKDLLTWEEQPIALYPDANGTMFSGCIVVDDKNTSGLFEEGQGGLVALITVNGEGQRVKLAYSTDEGKTWTKTKVVADWTEDSLQNRDFRDPKVFRWEDKWFMVIAGGPLRIYSSDNLQDWTEESAYADLHMECPDLYPIQADDGVVKWVLSRGGRGYKVGNFTKVDGKWRFVADSAYETTDGIMNFGKDSYAAMTYYIQDFGNAANPTLPEIIELNWMNTWDDYCRIVGDKVGQDFNGTYNLNLSVGLKKDGDRYVLTQTPIKTYETLRNTDQALVYKDVLVNENNDLFKDFAADSYEIVARFQPGADSSRLGFNLRVGDGEATKVIYDVATETLSLDRSQSGIILSNKFAQVDSQRIVRNADGSIDLHLFVDRSSVEVFAQGHTVAGANQIFPAPTSLGLQVFSEGDSSVADIAVYPLSSIWKDKKEVSTALDVIAASAEQNYLMVGKTATVKAYIMPAVAPQELIWSISDPSLATINFDGVKATLTALQRGQVVVRATAKENTALYKEFTFNLLEDNFKTNLSNLTSISGQWMIDGETLSDTNRGANDAYMLSEALPYGQYKMGVDIKYTNGLVNLFLASESSDPAHAYTIQFGDQPSIRLYRFYGDTIQEQPLPVAINDGLYHHVDVEKTKDSIIVAVDGTEVLNFRFETTDDYFNSPFIGLGLWDGHLEVQNLFVNPLTEQTPTPPAEEKPETPEKQPTETQGSEELPPSPTNTDKKDAEQNGQTSQTIPSPKPLATANQDKKIPQSGVSQTIQEKWLTSSEVARQSKPTLPNTGEVISFGGLAGLALLIGTVGYRKRRRED
ncbi:GH32 C-terminal domain-containing protein [Streptococcus suis]|uniref:GH32 C-terminal domain-containing protein n=1 Tax=Streptococcus suis TaxID=1307 RepID=UPI00209C6006|nr:GH32 C-terminal domain-containing protein [Streptococcus suis]MCO8220258.1 GH32 C-terminal domain-containing protein [Streptococcus suis]HEM3511796.1 GH32 C-terminal domain-containing protein [Streptococcus suis]HEM3526525.1 GH32 C-terminal domain-containing protein [Streptococcus suis]HEM6534557.1 GH32 C-terminal domain-containing protein [Streptococcus suis]HEM6561961.1 GH32 C-terminal domain-containing protein [Streptococcus suis]